MPHPRGIMSPDKLAQAKPSLGNITETSGERDATAQSRHGPGTKGNRNPGSWRGRIRVLPHKGYPNWRTGKTVHYALPLKQV